jgi:uncharacterized protein
VSREATAFEQATVVPTAAGDLAGVVRRPREGRLPGVVLVDGSGPGSKDEWGGWPEWVADCGAVVLRHDKPGCGGSPGDWREQDFEDRAHESLSAARVLRSSDGVSCVGLFGISQGGWVSLLAAARDPEAVDFVVTISGPGVTPAEQERIRITRDLERRGIRGTARDDALAWVDERTCRQLAGEDAESILADQQELEEREWYEAVTFGAYYDAGVLRFGARIMAFDPLPFARSLGCPALVLFGGADDVVPVARSVELLAGALPNLGDGMSGIAVFPRGNHGLFTADPDPHVPRRDQLAAGFLPMLESFIAAVDARSSGSG